MVKGSSPLPEPMFRQLYDQMNQKVSLAVIRFKRADFEPSIQVSDDEIRKYYDQHKDTFQSPEKRKVDLVSFLLNDEQKEITGTRTGCGQETACGTGRRVCSDCAAESGEF